VKTNQLPKAEKRELDSKEWDFRSIPQFEIEACHIYEYARELTRRSPRLSDLFAKWQAGWKGRKRTFQFSEGKKAYIEFRKIMTTCFPDFPLINGDWFPDTPWQELDATVRSRLVKQVNNGPQHYWHRVPSHKLHFETFKFEPQLRGEWKWRYVPEPFRREDISQIERGFFEINWHYTDAQLRRAFTEWLLEQRKDREKRGLTEVKYKPKGRGSCKDQLNWLAGLRVMRRYRKKELVDATGYRLKTTVPRPYSNYPELCEGAKKARRVLDLLSACAG
jgi:hypothetical protein